MLALAIFCEIFLAADWYAFAAVLPFVSESLKLNPAEAGLAQGIFAFPAGHFKFLRVWSVKFLHPRGRTRDC
ncbi:MULTISPECIES: hypothetical protein [Bradyrhizobium]|uniref:hypothetical protein n=1 Tax=Bradyrhizobium TaxID=374 RepID=UPI0004153839|nr:hypothetical protein [Bradyrhizobium japonicum]WLB86035.1 hypothetical protein QIH91_24165 [Bradyrhizobium japonicum USDA 135]